MTTKVKNKEGIWLSQREKVFASLYHRPQTRLEVAVATNTPIQNVCRLIAGFRKAGTVFIIRRDVCRISGMLAEYISTNPVYKAGHQIKMFE